MAFDPEVRRRLMESFRRLEEKGYLHRRRDYPPHPFGCDCIYIPSEADRLIYGDTATYEEPEKPPEQ